MERDPYKQKTTASDDYRGILSTLTWAASSIHAHLILSKWHGSPLSIHLTLDLYTAFQPQGLPKVVQNSI